MTHMIFKRHILIKIVFTVFVLSVTHTSTEIVWNEIEKIAEENPYVVAILDSIHEYLCTGFSITDRIVLTAGSCLTRKPAFVAISAVLGDDIVGKNILQVSHARLHNGFSSHVSRTQPSEVIMTNNIALIYVVDNKLDYIADLAKIGDFGPLQLRKQKLVAIGFGVLSVGTVVLHQQAYVQKTCVNPQWFYCVCGVEISSEYINDVLFGEGGPVLIGNQVVAVAGAPCGALMIPNTDTSYNIFTVITQYYPWIRQNRNYTTNIQYLKSLNNNCNCSAEVVLAYIVTLLIIGNFIN